MDPLACFSDDSDDEGDDEELQQHAKVNQKRKLDYKQLVDRGYVAPNLTSFVEGYREIERKEQEELQEKKQKIDEQEAEYRADVAKAKAFAQKWDTWLEPAADEARAELEAKKIAKAAAHKQKLAEGDKPWFASKSEAPEPSLPDLLATEVPDTQLAILDTSVPSQSTEELGVALVPITNGQDEKDKSFPLVATAQTTERRIMTFDSSGQRTLVAVSTVSNTTTQPPKKQLTYAEKAAKKWADEKRKEARGLVDRKKGGGIENLPVKQLVTTYNQRLNNIMHMEKNLDTLLKKGKPTYKDQRTDMAYDDLRKCGAGAGN